MVLNIGSWVVKEITGFGKNNWNEMLRSTSSVTRLNKWIYSDRLREIFFYSHHGPKNKHWKSDLVIDTGRPRSTWLRWGDETGQGNFQFNWGWPRVEPNRGKWIHVSDLSSNWNKSQWSGVEAIKTNKKLKIQIPRFIKKLRLLLVGSILDDRENKR